MDAIVFDTCLNAALPAVVKELCPAVVGVIPAVDRAELLHDRGPSLVAVVPVMRDLEVLCMYAALLAELADLHRTVAVYDRAELMEPEHERSVVEVAPAVRILVVPFECRLLAVDLELDLSVCVRIGAVDVPDRHAFVLAE